MRFQYSLSNNNNFDSASDNSFTRAADQDQIETDELKASTSFTSSAGAFLNASPPPLESFSKRKRRTPQFISTMLKQKKSRGEAPQYLPPRADSRDFRNSVELDINAGEEIDINASDANQNHLLQARIQDDMNRSTLQNDIDISANHHTLLDDIDISVNHSILQNDIDINAENENNDELKECGSFAATINAESKDDHTSAVYGIDSTNGSALILSLLPSFLTSTGAFKTAQLANANASGKLAEENLMRSKDGCASSCGSSPNYSHAVASPPSPLSSSGLGSSANTTISSSASQANSAHDDAREFHVCTQVRLKDAHGSSCELQMAHDDGLRDLRTAHASHSAHDAATNASIGLANLFELARKVEANILGAKSNEQREPMKQKNAQNETESTEKKLNFSIESILTAHQQQQKHRRENAISTWTEASPFPLETLLANTIRSVRSSYTMHEAGKEDSLMSPHGAPFNTEARICENEMNRFPAWIFCTRYSDRPSCGSRSRKLKQKRRPSEDSSLMGPIGNEKRILAMDEEKRPRTAFTAEQLARLKQQFVDSRYLTEKRRQELAHELGLNESQIKIWFQNKRAKLKKSSHAEVYNAIGGGGSSAANNFALSSPKQAPTPAHATFALGQIGPNAAAAGSSFAALRVIAAQQGIYANAESV